MRGDLAELDGRSFDLCVLGGGIHAATIAHAGATAGLKVLLAQSLDFASDVPPGSPGLLDATLRSLCSAGPNLESAPAALEERERLLRALPHLVRPLPILWLDPSDAIPESAWRVSQSTLPEPRRQDASSCAQMLLSLVPAASAVDFPVDLSATSGGEVAGGLLFYDARVCERRWILWELRAAVAAGAEVFNYTELCSRQAETLRFRDGLAGATNGMEVEMTASAIVDATGGNCSATAQRLHGASLASFESGVELYGELVETRHDLWPRLNGDTGICVRDGDHLVVAVPTQEGTATSQAWPSQVPSGLGGGSRRGTRRRAGVAVAATVTKQNGCAVVAGHDLLATRTVARRVFDCLQLSLGIRADRRFFEQPSEEVGDPLWWRHGPDAPQLRKLAAEHSSGEPLLRPLASGSSLLEIEVLWAIREQAAVTLPDLILRLAPLTGKLTPEELARTEALFFAEGRGNPIHD